MVDVGVLSTLTLAGSAAATIAVGALGHRFPASRLMLAAAWTMVATGLGFAGLHAFWPLALVAFVGTLNPSSGDVSVFLPLEHARLARAAVDSRARTALFSRYALAGGLSAAIGALASAWPAWWSAHAGGAAFDAMRAMFVLYALIGGVVALLYRGFIAHEHRDRAAAGDASAANLDAPQPLGPVARHRRSGWPACSASTRSPAACWSTRSWRCGCSSASGCRWRTPASSSSRRA